MADNCTDKTAEVARTAGAVVYERFNDIEVGKGYALRYIFNIIKDEYKDISYDGYFIFDADNLLDSKYITEMNKVFSNGYEAVTSFRNTKNFGDNWITAGYGIWFIRESEMVNNPRSKLGVSCAVSGTGFVISDKLLEETGRWKYHTLTEDLEFTADMVSSGRKIGYAGDAILYDEQPTSFSQSVRQRSRWMKGSMQVLSKYASPLVKNIVKNGNFSSYDTLMTFIPGIFFTAISVIVNLTAFIIGLATESENLSILFESVITGAVNAYLFIYALGLLPLILEWKRIKCVFWKKIFYSFFYPLFVLGFIPALLKALFGNIEWKPIHHTVSISISDLSGDGKP